MPKIKQYETKYKTAAFCKWVESERIARHATQSEFGRVIGVSRPTYVKKINERTLTLDDALKFIQLLNPDDDLKLYLLKV